MNYLDLSISASLAAFGGEVRHPMQGKGFQEGELTMPWKCIYRGVASEEAARVLIVLGVAFETTSGTITTSGVSFPQTIIQCGQPTQSRKRD